MKINVSGRVYQWGMRTLFHIDKITILFVLMLRRLIEITDRLVTRKTSKYYQIMPQSWPPGPRLYNYFVSTQLSMKYIIPINVKMPTIVGISLL